MLHTTSDKPQQPAFLYLKQVSHNVEALLAGPVRQHGVIGPPRCKLDVAQVQHCCHNLPQCRLSGH